MNASRRSRAFVARNRLPISPALAALAVALWFGARLALDVVHFHHPRHVDPRDRSVEEGRFGLTRARFRVIFQSARRLTIAEIQIVRLDADGEEIQDGHLPFREAFFRAHELLRKADDNAGPP